MISQINVRRPAGGNWVVLPSLTKPVHLDNSVLASIDINRLGIDRTFSLRIHKARIQTPKLPNESRFT
jgi:hypothetical protein